jgi:RHS repeat-associated protein
MYLDGLEILRRYGDDGAPAYQNETIYIEDGYRRIALIEKSSHATSSEPVLVRYQHVDTTLSVGIELDDQARVISYEEYTPFGTSSYFATQVPKRYRYNSKEWDSEPGLYYYGARYYYPSIGRWINCDPAGFVDGVNLYCFVRCNPINLIDLDGRVIHKNRRVSRRVE